MTTAVPYHLILNTKYHLQKMFRKGEYQQITFLSLFSWQFTKISHHPKM